MNDSTVIFVSIIGSFPATIAAILSFINVTSIIRSERHLLEIKNKIVELEKNTNSRMDELVKVVGSNEMPNVIIRQENT